MTKEEDKMYVKGYTDGQTDTYVRILYTLVVQAREVERTDKEKILRFLKGLVKDWEIKSEF